MSQIRPLLVASDETVREEVLRLAAAVDCEIDNAADAGAAAGSWTRAPLVLIDEAALTPGAPGLPYRTRVLLICDGSPDSATWQRAFTSGVQQVITLPADEGELISALADVVETPGEQDGRVIAVVGARGGSGASVLSAGIAARATIAGESAFLVDCDALGGGLDLLLGAEREDGLRWPGLRVNSGRVSMTDLHEALPGYPGGGGRMPVLSCGRTGAGPTHDSIAAVVDAGRRAGRLVVCDLGRGLEPASRAAATRADLVLLVVPAEVRACAAAARVVGHLAEHVDRSIIRTVVRAPGPDGLDGDDIAEALDVPLLSVLRPERGLARALERGVFTPRGRGPLAGTAHAALDAVRARAHAGVR